jgi:hypothetical protein
MCGKTRSTLPIHGRWGRPCRGNTFPQKGSLARDMASINGAHGKARPESSRLCYVPSVPRGQPRASCVLTVPYRALALCPRPYHQRCRMLGRDGGVPGVAMRKVGVCWRARAMSVLTLVPPKTTYHTSIMRTGRKHPPRHEGSAVGSAERQVLNGEKGLMTHPKISGSTDGLGDGEPGCSCAAGTW